jgi:hypothetical protein
MNDKIKAKNSRWKTQKQVFGKSGSIDGNPVEKKQNLENKVPGLSGYKRLKGQDQKRLLKYFIHFFQF